LSHREKRFVKIYLKLEEESGKSEKGKPVTGSHSTMKKKESVTREKKNNRKREAQLCERADKAAGKDSTNAVGQINRAR